MRWLLVVGALIGCGFEHGKPGGSGDATTTMRDADVLGDSAPTAPWLTTHSYRKPIRIMPGGAGTVTDMPIAIRRLADSDLAARASVSGDDIAITAADGTMLLAHERAYFEKTTGELELWVTVPSLALGETTWLYLYYGGSATQSAPMWTSGYRGVWHMSSSSAATMELDSTSNANHIAQLLPTFVPGSGSGAAPTGDALGRARMFDGVDDRLTVPDPLDGSLDVGVMSFAVTLWLYAVQSNGTYDPPFYKGGTNPGNPGYTIFTGTGSWAGKIMDNTGTFRNPVFSAAPINGRWVQLAMSIDRNAGGNTWTTFVDGAIAASGVFNLGSFADNADLIIGQAGTNFFQGSIDEVRVYSRTVSPEWVATEHANLTDPDFVTIGAQQAK